MKINQLLVYFLFMCFVDGVILPSIPTHLLECYRAGGPNLAAPRRLDVLLSLLKKLELNSQLDMRMFSTALLRRLRLDGVELASDITETEFILPYRASAFQFHKYRLMMELFLPSQNTLEVDDTLSLEEKCLLHKLLSSAVQQWERGDENVVCPVSEEQRQSMVTEGSTRIHSRCPIEDGVIQTEWGTISPGTLIAAIAASLESQRVLVTDILNANIFKAEVAEPLLASAMQEWFEDIESFDLVKSERQVESADIGNIWVATLAGDLAELIINQGPRVGAAPQRMAVGSNNRWNNTYLPRHHYIITQNASVIDWHFTDAEILAGIDGMILARYLPSWVEQRRTLKLSQVIDMYYSNDGVSFEPSVKACNRQVLFNNIFNSSDLNTEASRFAHVLALRQITVYIPLEEMERITNAAVTAFVNYIPNILRLNQKNCQIGYNVPEMDLIVATDGSWKGYDVEQFISWIGGALEINLQRSSMALVHGNTGRWIVPPSDNLTTVFSHISNFTDEWPNRLNLPSVITAAIQHSLNKTLLEVEKQASAGLSTVILVVSPTDRPGSTELERSRELMKTLRTTYFDVYFAYAADALTEFQNVNNEYLDYSELFFKISSPNVQDVINVVDTYLLKSEIPTKIIGALCPVNDTVYYNQAEYEDFVTNGKKSYRIHPYYLGQQALVNVQFRNSGQGKISVCMWRGAETPLVCHTLEERAVHTFNLTTPCPSPEFCVPAHFSVTVQNFSNTCANTDCRFPHQVGYYLQHSGLRCLSLRNSAAAAVLHVFRIKNIVSIMMISLLLNFTIA